MNILKVHTLASSGTDTFRVHWTNSLVRGGGLIEVKIMREDIQDKQIVAELAALQHLLEVKQVVGQNLVGSSGTRLIVSLGAIRKLQRRQSDKTHLAPYASFLTTRFAGCEIFVDKDARWFEKCHPASMESLIVDRPCGETIQLAGLGEVSVTRHVLERIAMRILPDTNPDRAAQAAWKKLKELASDPSVREVSRKSLWAGVIYGHHGKGEGRYFLNERRDLVLVVTDNPHEGKRLVTAYPASQRFRPIHMTA